MIDFHYNRGIDVSIFWQNLGKGGIMSLLNGKVIEPMEAEVELPKLGLRYELEVDIDNFVFYFEPMENPAKPIPLTKGKYLVTTESIEKAKDEWVSVVRLADRPEYVVSLVVLHKLPNEFWRLLPIDESELSAS